MELNQTERQILGLDHSALEPCAEHRLLPRVGAAFTQLAAAARHSGFDLRIASAYRSYQRQQLIWNQKLQGERLVLDDDEQPVDMQCLSVEARLAAVLRFSALPGASRHHWGTDIDVYDHAAMADDYKLQLSACEVESGGCFAPLHDWLDEAIDRGESYGFYRPYDRDRGGVARERWHLSFAPLATQFASKLDAALVKRAWGGDARAGDICLRNELAPQLDAILERYVHRVASPPAAALRYVASAN